MSPIEHYCEAEKLLREYEIENHNHGWTITPVILTMALIHATLATASIPEDAQKDLKEEVSAS